MATHTSRELFMEDTARIITLPTGQWQSCAQLAKTLDLSPRTIYRRVRAGQIQTLQTPQGTRYRLAPITDTAPVSGVTTDTIAVSALELVPNGLDDQTQASAVSATDTASVSTEAYGVSGGVSPLGLVQHGLKARKGPSKDTPTDTSTDSGGVSADSSAVSACQLPTPIGLEALTPLVTHIASLTQQLLEQAQHIGRLQAELDQAHADHKAALEVVEDQLLELLELECRLSAPA